MVSKNSREVLLYSKVPGIGLAKLANLLRLFPSYKDAKSTTVSQLISSGLTEKQAESFLKSSVDYGAVDRELEFLDKNPRFGFVTINDDLYPKNLTNIYDPPLFLYYEGLPPQKDDVNSLAIVGSRKIHSQSIQIVEKFCQELANTGLVIVSGLAMGVDSVAHLSTIKSQKRTIAVLGCGINLQHNQTVIPVREKIVDNGGTVYSSFTTSTPAAVYTFPARNRIISGLCMGVLVAEAQLGSGSLITADFALEQGREVFALPNHIYNDKFTGSNNLIKKGMAKCVTSIEDVLEELPLKFKKANSDKQEIIENITFSSKEEERIYKKIKELGSVHIDQLMEDLNFDSNLLLSSLMLLELKRAIKREIGNVYSLKI